MRATLDSTRYERVPAYRFARRAAINKKRTSVKLGVFSKWEVVGGSLVANTRGTIIGNSVAMTRALTNTFVVALVLVDIGCIQLSERSVIIAYVWSILSDFS